MHRSRIGEITIDCKTDDLAHAATFWSAALGYRAVPFENHYRFQIEGDELAINLQSVTHASRVHIDIETDSIALEVRRLEQLGARSVRVERRWVVMETPTGHRICVCRPARKLFHERAHRWT